MERKIHFELNGKPVEETLDPGLILLWVLRNRFKLTGTKYGCGEGYCRSCTVLLDNEAVRSCSVTVGEVEGRKVTTIEGLEHDGQLHPLQEAFIEHDALQCGYCTPGMIMNAAGLLGKNPSPTRQQIIDGMEDNLCRCGAHTRIIDAIESASGKMKGRKQP
jgi:aerobic-type carbon monoxide dehydrogenase small subunit (CoxS/CutS family)